MRPAEADEVARLLAVDPDVPGLRLLLDDDALATWLADRLGSAAVVAGVRRTYLRWKPGAGGVARVRLGRPVGPDGSVGPDGRGADDLFLAVWHRDAAAKLDKTVLRGGPAVVVVDRVALAVLGLPAADRDLPALARLTGPRPGGAVRRLDPVDERAGRRLHRVAGSPSGPTTLAWKPQRRWVGAVGSSARGRVVLRAYRPQALPVARERYRAVAAVLGDAAPGVLGENRRRGLLAVEHLHGRRLDDVATVDAGTADRAAGALLARLHSAAPGPGAAGRLDPGAEGRAVEAAARTVDLLVPDAGAVPLARELVRALHRLPRPVDVLLHGDLSGDQVVVDAAGGVGLIDLDELAVGPASYDLAGITASWWLADAGAAGDRVQALLDGYRGANDGPGPDELRVRTAAHLLRRAPEAFRSGRAGWSAHVVRTVRTAAVTLAGGPPAALPPLEREEVLL